MYRYNELSNEERYESTSNPPVVTGVKVPRICSENLLTHQLSCVASMYFTNYKLIYNAVSKK